MNKGDRVIYSGFGVLGQEKKGTFIRKLNRRLTSTGPAIAEVLFDGNKKPSRVLYTRLKEEK